MAAIADDNKSYLFEVNLHIRSGCTHDTVSGSLDTLMADEEFDKRVGTWLRNKWKLERLIAVGGMAGVFEAKHKIGRVAAIKLLRSEIAVNKGVRERFEQEAAAVNAVAHHAVVQVLDVDEDEDGIPFLVMELLEGETLADRVERDKKMKPDQLLDMVDQLLDVLVACHKKGVIHRDIKPENLFLQKNGRLKVLDFGIARVREGVRTRAGTMLGTVAFMPPEQLKGEDIDARADIFAVGATMFAVAAGRRLHIAKDDTELAMKMLTEPCPRLATVTSAPEPLCLVVDRALAFLPKRRYPDAQTMRGDVWAARRGEKPPYASACLRAGQDPDVLVEGIDKDKKGEKPSKTKAERRVDLPSTDPQMPVFVKDMPKATLPTTDPQMPAFDEAQPESDEPSGRPTKDYVDPDAKARERPQKTKLGIVDSETIAKLKRPKEEEEAEEPPDTDETWPREEDEDEDSPSDEDSNEEEPPSEEESGDDPADSEPADSEPADSEPADSEPPESGPSGSEPPESEPPMSEAPDSLPPQGALEEVDARAVAEAQNKSYGFVVIILVLLGAAAYGAWYAGVLG